MFYKFKGKIIVFSLVVVVLLILAVTFCDVRKMGKWEKIKSTPRLHEANAIWFGDGIGLFFGHCSSHENMLEKDIDKWNKMREAIILRTTKNKDKWIKIYSGKGDIYSVSCRDNNVLYALGGEYLSYRKHKPFILNSNDLGKTWLNLSTPPMDNPVGIDFKAKMVGYVWSNKLIYGSLDGGNTWDKVDISVYIFPNEAQPVVDGNGVLWVRDKGYIDQDGVIRVKNRTQIISFNIEKQKKIETLPVGFDPDVMACSSNNDLWLVGRKNEGTKDEHIEVVRRIGDNKYETIANLHSFLSDYLYVGNDVIAILGAEVVRMSVTKILMISEDNGKTWRRELIPRLARVPAYFENDYTLWLTGIESIYRRTGR